MTEPVLPTPPDESDEGWGEPVPADGSDEALRRLLEERPPHHGS